MPKIAGDPLRKVTLNLYKADVEWLQREQGQGYTEIVRDAIRLFVAKAKVRALEEGKEP